jgi:vacuolar-type H+-ATPase subunit I/STV1
MSDAQTNKPTNQKVSGWGKATLPLGIVSGILLGGVTGGFFGNVGIGLAIGAGIGVGVGFGVTVAIYVFHGPEPSNWRP